MVNLFVLAGRVLLEKIQVGTAILYHPAKEQGAGDGPARYVSIRGLVQNVPSVPRMLNFS